MNLKFTHRFSSKHNAWPHGGGVFTQAVEKTSSGGVTFETYPAAQLGKDYFSPLHSGLADIKIISTNLLLFSTGLQRTPSTASTKNMAKNINSTIRS